MPMQRRELLNTCGALSVAVLAGVQVAEAAESRYCSPEDPLQALMEGNRRFSRAWQDAATNPSTDLSVQLHGNRCFNPPGDLIDGQQPWATVLTPLLSFPGIPRGIPWGPQGTPGESKIRVR